MAQKKRTVLILGSGADALTASKWPRDIFNEIVSINNAWRVRPDWTHLIYPEDFPVDRRPGVVDTALQTVVTAKDFVPVQNQYGGFVYAGGTMAFTAGYWALGALKPDVLAFFGCDMIYGKSQTHFYGNGTADPLRDDVTLQSLEAKSARLMLLAAGEGCLTVNLSEQHESRLVFPRAKVSEIAGWSQPDRDAKLATVISNSEQSAMARAMTREADLAYFAESGRYWEEPGTYDAEELRELDARWLAAANPQSISKFGETSNA